MKAKDAELNKKLRSKLFNYLLKQSAYRLASLMMCYLTNAEVKKLHKELVTD